MALTIHRYKFDSSYILGEEANKVRIDFSLAKNLHKEYIEQRGNNDMGNIIFGLFEQGGIYNTRLHINENILNHLGIKEEDLDFIVLADNENGVDLKYLYKAAFVFQVLSKIEENKTFLLENNKLKFPQCMSGILQCMDFSKKAIEDGDLMLFWYQ